MTTPTAALDALEQRTENICKIAYDKKLQAEQRRRMIRLECEALCFDVRTALQNAPEWLPIETAPKDTEIFIHGGTLSPDIGEPRDNETFVMGYFDTQYENNKWVVSNTSYYEVEIEKPTKWMPLPPAPHGVKVSGDMEGV